MNILIRVTPDPAALTDLPYCDFDGGIMVDQGDLDAILEAMSLEANGDLQTTQFEGVSELPVNRVERPAAPEEGVEEGEHPPVEYGHWSSNASDSNAHRDRVMASIRTILYDTFQKPVLLNVPHGYPSEPAPTDDSRIHIRIWSNQDNRQSETNVPRQVFGVTVHCRETPYLPSDEGMRNGNVIMDSDYPVAEVVNGNTLYIFHDLVHTGHSDEIALLEKILEEASILLSGDEEQIKEMRERLLAAKTERSRADYVTLCNKRYDAQIRQSKRTYEQSQRQIDDYQQALVSAIRQREEAGRVLGELESGQTKDADSHLAEYEKLLSLDKITGVEVVGNQVTYHTKVLHCTDPRTNRVHEVGAFKITINVENGSVRFYNTTRRINGHNRRMHAPHVFPSGEPCLGNVSQYLPDLIAKYEFAAVADVVIAFIENVNINDAAGAYVNRWPYLDEHGRLIEYGSDAPDDVPDEPEDEDYDDEGEE